MIGRAARASLHCLTAFATLWCIACDTPATSPQPDLESLGNVTVAVGADVRNIPFGAVRCSAEGDVTRVELDYPAKIAGPQGNPARPRVLIARFRDDEVLEAHAFLPRVNFADVDYPMLQVVAAPVDGADSADCRLERGEQLSLACNRGTVVPWLSPGERPTPSFKAEFNCP